MKERNADKIIIIKYMRHALHFGTSVPEPGKKSQKDWELGCSGQ